MNSEVIALSMDMIHELTPIPNLSKFQRFLFVGPHPDDVEIGCGGLAYHLAKQGKQVFFLIATDGGCGSSNANQGIPELVEIRKNEAQSAATLLQANELFFLDFPDGGNYDVNIMSEKMAKVILQINPDVIFMPDSNLPSEIHPDHIQVAKAAQKAKLIAQFPLMAKRNFVEISNPSAFRPRVLAYYFTHRPNTIIDLSLDEVERKMMAIHAHESQFPSRESFDMLLGYLSLRGNHYKKDPKSASSEAYFVLDEIHQHYFPEINLR